jgi:sulfur-carrier protein adenylyltransferase/sulfurtransferase
MLPELSPQEKDRYDRHLRIPEIGEEGQRKLKAASALVVGVGGLGSPLAMYLAASGIGRIGLVDSDVLALSNLQRQIIHGEANLNEPKVESAARRLHDLNSEVQIDIYPERFTAENAERLTAPYDLIMDGTDNLATRNVINRVAVKLGKPYIYGGVFQFEGQMSLFDASRGPCYRCLFAEAPKNNENASPLGVFSALPGVIATLQVTEAVKYILNIGEPMIGKLLLFDGLAMSFQTIHFDKKPDCPVCGNQA